MGTVREMREMICRVVVIGSGWVLSSLHLCHKHNPKKDPQENTLAYTSILRYSGFLGFKRMECSMITTTAATATTLQPCLTRRLRLIGNFCSGVEGSRCKWKASSIGFPKSYKSSTQAFLHKCSNRNMSWKLFCSPLSLEEEFSEIQSNDFSKDQQFDSEDDDDDADARPLSADELKTLLADTQRSKLLKKLSEANQQNRFLKRQLQVKEDALINFKSELAGIELQIQALIALAEEITKIGIPEGSRKINGKYIQSHVLSRLEAIQETLKEQIKDVDAAQSKEVPLFWSGMAESVQVMGSFDGWSQGEHLSPEYTGSYTKFSTTLMLPPGRYEIKFLVNGEWQISPEFPTVGEGLMKNNLLVVE